MLILLQAAEHDRNTERLKELIRIKTEVRIRVGPQVEKSPNLHITRDSTGSIHENVRGKKFDPKKVLLGWGNLS